MVTKKKEQKKRHSKNSREYFRINQKITAPKVQLVGSDITVGIYNHAEALAIARKKGLDLVEISNKGDIPICKVVDFAKFRYERKKVQKAKERANKVSMKEVRIAPTIGSHDFAFKKRHAVKFLESGASVRVQVFFRRKRDFYVHRELGKAQLQSLIEALEAHGGKLKQPIKLLGRQMFTIIDPPKKRS